MDVEVIDDIEMEEERNEEEATEREGEEEETIFIDDNRRFESILIIDGSNPLFVRPDDASISERPEGSAPDAGKDAGVMKRYMIHDKKQFLKDGLGITVNKGDGPSSTILYDEMRTVTSEKGGKINGAEYRGKKILIMKGGKMEYSTSKGNAPYVSEFKELLNKAYAEHQKTPAALVEDHVGVDVTQETMDSITDNVTDRIETRIDDAVDDITTNTEVTENELRELRGLLDPKGPTLSDKLDALKIERDNWKKRAEEEGNTRKGKFYESVAEIADLKVDELRLELNQKPETEEVTDMVKDEAETNDLTRFEKCKKWAMENLVNMSALAISIAGIITTVVMAGRGALKSGANALGKFGKAVAKIVKKLGSVLSAVGTLIANVLSWGAKGLLFLAKNLWILVLALTYFVYSEYMTRRRSLR